MKFGGILRDQVITWEASRSQATAKLMTPGLRHPASLDRIRVPRVEKGVALMLGLPNPGVWDYLINCLWRPTPRLRGKLTSAAGSSG